ncbi:ATP-binding protein [Allorhizobium sp. BGMRC 0089]|uniref:ATP-binding protein n=1 Tax=Allorhizobium sonneratiae TaxID=2934936 RepID=UPI0020339262|nr:ATP-binding protein [Allorhizobium sonneratiae]MCM2291239.1 ATP-binding protein [Allorhizobium sonneratiae]
MTLIEAIGRFKDTQRRLPRLELRWFSRWLRRQFPTGLYARTLLIIILPMLILQTVLLFVFMERHWQLVTQRLSAAVTHDIASIIDLLEAYPNDKDRILTMARDRMGLIASLEKGGDLPAPRPKPFFSILDQVLSDELRNQIKRPFWIDTLGDSPLIEIRIKLGDHILRIFTRRSQAYASNSHIFLVWMYGTSLVLIIIATLFLRGQIRPILALAAAAESFGKGQPAPENFSPRGADEIRRAGLAFMLMRERIERQMEQRTAMLTGVSHDLRTILTRFKLQLALSGDNPDLEPLNEDVDAMQSMLEGYMAFARGEAEEDFGPLNLNDMMNRIADDYALHGKSFRYELQGNAEIIVRPHAFWRLIGNLAANGRRYANHVEVDIRHGAKWLTVTFDDDGPGIPAQSREDVFKPFFRLDEARNLDATGTGLGLAIARDIARSHGGNVTLSDSPLGGLRATVRVPV